MHPRDGKRRQDGVNERYVGISGPTAKRAFHRTIGTVAPSLQPIDTWSDLFNTKALPSPVRP